MTNEPTGLNQPTQLPRNAVWGNSVRTVVPQVTGQETGEDTKWPAFQVRAGGVSHKTERGATYHHSPSLSTPSPPSPPKPAGDPAQTENQENTLSAMFELMKNLGLRFDNLEKKVNTLMGNESTNGGVESVSESPVRGVDGNVTGNESRVLLSDEGKGADNGTRRKENRAPSARCKSEER